MNDYTYCSDWRETCPKSCFRAEITDNMRPLKVGEEYSFAHFKGTDECVLTHGDIIRRMSNNEIATLLYCVHKDARAVYTGEQRRYMYPSNGADWKEWVNRSGRYSQKGETP